MPTDTLRTELTQAGLNLIQQALSIYDSDLRLVVSNRMFSRMFGLPEALVAQGASFEDTIRFLVASGEYGDVDDHEDFVDQRVRQARAFEPHYMERTRANGRVISVEGSPLPQGGWVTVYTDITQIKKQESLLRARSVGLAEKLLEHTEQTAAANRRLAAANMQLEEAKRALTATEARTRLTAEMVPAHISRIGPDRRYTFSNRRLGTVLPGCTATPEGQGIEQVLGTERFTRIEASLVRAEAGESSVYEFNDPDSERRIRVAFTPEIQNDVVIGVYLLSMDVTEEARARSALTHTHKRELAAQLTSGLAHDFANLLTIILGAQSRLNRLALPEEAGALVAATTAAARRGGVLLDRLSQISGGRQLRKAATDLPALLDEIVTLAKPSLPVQIALSVRIEGLDAPLLLDAGSLQDVLLNLILNARDAIGDVPGKIEISASQRGAGWITLAVCDSGAGFSEDAIKRAVDPFYSTKGMEGSGLGLTMVYDIAKLAGGHMWLARSRRLGGARVQLELPYERAESAPTKALLVLLVDDSADIRANVRDMLVQIGHQVIEAASIDEALALSHLDGLGLVLSDLSLAGGETGLMLIDALHDAGRPLPARLMTSRPPGDALRDRAAAACPVIAKPFSADDLAAFLAPRAEAAE